MDFDLSLIFKILGSLSLPIILIILFFKQRRQKLKQEQFPSPTVVGEGEIYDEEALIAAEKAVAKMDLRAEFLKNGLIKIDQFYTLHGYDQNSMLRITKQLQDQDITADFLFIQSLPTGAASYMGNTGVFELFVDSEKEEQARSLLAKILNP